MTLRVDDKGWLELGSDIEVVRIPTVRTTPLLNDEAEGVVWHYTRTPPYFNPELMAKYTAKYKRGVHKPKSWHCLIASTGVIYQIAPFLVGTWHCGVPGDFNGKSFKNLNQGTIGIELENAGMLRQLKGDFYCHPYFEKGTKKPNKKRKIDNTDVVILAAQAWHDFTDEQIETATALVEALKTRYNWDWGCFNYGHKDFDPKRKQDPGLQWSNMILPEILNKVFGKI